METWYKFILYGTYDGFSRSTLGDDNLYLVLENGEKVEVPRCFVKNASDFIEKDKLKLKDVIARIKKLDLGTQKVWLNEILNKLGSDYGTLKYKAGYEQGKVEGALIHCEEPQKITVPQFVADYIKYAKDSDWDLIDAMKGISYEDYDDLMKWFYNESNQETFARAWLDGYEVEKEKRYLVKIIGITDYNSYLNYHKEENKWTIESSMDTATIRTKHTRKELEEDGFGWMFDCPGIEIEEVE